jgi:hypothetical protein
LSPIPALIHVVDLSRISSLVPTSRKGVFGQCCRISGYHYNKDDAVFTWFTSLWEQYDIPQYLWYYYFIYIRMWHWHLTHMWGALAWPHLTHMWGALAWPHLTHMWGALAWPHLFTKMRVLGP